jgi:tRNA modification GTPase
MRSDYALSDETIVALSTPPGIGAIGVIRLSGKQAIEICNTIFKGKDLTRQKTHTLHYGKIQDGEEVIDEVVVGIFREPHSYTKENMVEISCHGSPYILQKTIEMLIEKGARPARAGEFTLRAFLNGRFDLSQAEAVADLIASNSEMAHKVAMQQMRGRFSSQIQQLRQELIHFTALIELELDFAEEDVEFASRHELQQLVEKLMNQLSDLIRSFKWGNVIKNGVSTVIAGRPNAGKSTLLNALLQEERAIVSEIAGTTRDVIEETLNINGIHFRLIDTAGIREATDTIEKMGIERTMQKIRQSAIVIYLFDVNTMSAEEVKQDLQSLNIKDVPVIPVGNKIDICGEVSARQRFGSIENTIYISSKTELHLDDLKNTLSQQVLNEKIDFNSTIVTNVRHYEALLDAQRALTDVWNGIHQKISGEWLALDIRRALHALGSITAEIDVDKDILETIFTRFCIGK